jgi:phosphoribosyl-ATP pyrophosphohydrolase/phosphoribosyl-AMP cyclohydrolase
MKKNYADVIKRIDFSKANDGLVPAVVQDASTDVVLMLGYMNREALEETISNELVTFYSRSKQRLWVKGETSKNFLHLV